MTFLQIHGGTFPTPSISEPYSRAENIHYRTLFELLHASPKDYDPYCLDIFVLSLKGEVGPHMRCNQGC